MAYIQFEKDQLKDFDYSLNKEYLDCNRYGAYTSSTIIGCNTRKYHGLLVAPQSQIDNENHVLLSSLDENIINNGENISLANHRYPGIHFPNGYVYLDEFTADPIPKWTFHIEDIVLTKEILIEKGNNRVLVRYTCEKADRPFSMRFTPLLAFRNVNQVKRANMALSKKFQVVDNGIKLKIYAPYHELFLQFSRKVDYIPAPDWYYNIEYPVEQERGYDYQEDLYTPGYFEIEMKEGADVIFSGGTKERSSKRLKSLLNDELKAKRRLFDFENILVNAAQQFVVRSGKNMEVVAGYHWFGRWGRDTFIALPGLTLVIGNFKECKAVLDSMLRELKDGLFPNAGSGRKAHYNSVDAPLWFFWALQQFAIATGTKNRIWKEYGNKMRSILEKYRKGTQYNIKMQPDGLIYAGAKGIALTWMDAIVNGKPVTPRTGMPVEVNALWYNAICFALETAELAGDQKFTQDWKVFPEMIRNSFIEKFWDQRKGYLADYVADGFSDWSVRPNQVIATSLPYSMLTSSMATEVLNKVEKELLTPRGLRTLSPNDPQYIGFYHGGQASRDKAYHQGTVWPWLLGHFVEGYLKIHGKEGLPFVQKLYNDFVPTLKEQGIHTISEVFDGDFPHKAGGAISQAWSISELLRIHALIIQASNGKSSIKNGKKDLEKEYEN